MKKVFFFLGLFFTLVSVSLAQTSKGFIVGNVTDPTGAAVTGAEIRATNAETGTSRTTVSQDDGSYRLDAVDPGPYTVEVTATGFRTVRRENVVVAAAQTVEVALPLEIGARAEEVTITSETPVTLQTEDGARVNTLDRRQITDLPVPGLNPVSIVLTLPGVSDTTQTLAGGFVQGSEFNVNGLRARSNNQLIDGLDNNDNSVAGQFYQPVLRDGYDEVTLLTSDYSAEFGRAGGAVVNVISRSGKNDFHGSVYDIINNSRLRSRTPQERMLGLSRSDLRLVENTYGFSFGGPVVRNKLFFFGTFQADQIRSSTVATGTVPTAAGFATLRSLFPAGTNVNVDRYLSIVGDLRGTTNPFTVALGGGRSAVEFGTVTRAAPQPVNDYQYLARVDWTPTDRDSFAFRYLADKQNFVNQFPTIFAGFEVDVPSLIQNQYVSYTRNFSPRVTNEFRFGYGRFNVLFAPPNSAALNGPTIAFSGAGLGRGISGIGLSSSFPQGRIFNNFQFQDTVTYSIGKHSFRIGADLNKQRSKQFVPFNSRGALAFSAGGGFTALGNFVDNFSGSTGSAAISFGSQVIYPDAFYQSYFINDNWRVRDNLTLNLGLRYENNGTPFNVVAFPAFPGFGQPFNAVVQQRRDNNNFAPRVSFAYQPGGSNLTRVGRALFGERKSVLRGGFAVNYDFFFNNILSNTAASAPNVFGSTLLGSTVGGRGQANFGGNSLPTTGAANPLTAITTIDPNLRNPKTFVWNLGVQRETPFGIIADVAYVGSRGTGLFINEQLNPGVAGFGVALRRQFTNRGSVTARTNGGDSVYHSLQARAERGFRNNFLFRASYTFSKAIDNVNSEVFVTSGGASVGSQPFNKRLDRSVATFDVPHVFALTTLYTMPNDFLGLGNRYLNSVFGGFTISGIYRLQSGAVETPYVGGIDLNGDGSAFNDRPTINNTSASQRSVAILASLFGIGGGGYVDANGDPIALNNAYYVVDPSLRSGIAARNTLRGPRFSRLDLSLSKSFRVPYLFENDRFEIRADMFNALNHPTFGPGTGDVTSTDFFDPSTTSGTRRVIQFQLRYAF